MISDLISTALQQRLKRNRIQKLLNFCKVIRDENTNSIKIASTYISKSLQTRYSDKNIYILQTKHDELMHQYPKVYATYFIQNFYFVLSWFQDKHSQEKLVPENLSRIQDKALIISCLSFSTSISRITWTIPSSTESSFDPLVFAFLLFFKLFPLFSRTNCPRVCLP